MKNSKILKTILAASGLIAIAVGFGILCFPVAFYATNDIALAGRTSLLNEVRASGGAILAVGGLVLSGAFFERLRYAALLISAVMYSAYGISRVLSVLLDGTPAVGLIAVTVLELFIGAVCFFALWRFAGTDAEKISAERPAS